jgi:hypothetical protein
MRSASLALAAAPLVVALAIFAMPVLAADAPPDASAVALSAYLHTHRLPLVEARLVRDRLGFDTLVLYGFVATNFGKSDAEAQSRRFLKQPDILIDNRIKVRPELLHPNAGTAVASTANEQRASGPTDDENAPRADAEAGLALGDIQAYEDQEENDLQIGGPFVQPIPLVALGMIPLAPTAPPAWAYPPMLFGPPMLFYGYRPFTPAPWITPARPFATVPITGPIGTATFFAPPVTPGRIMPLPGVLPRNYIPPSVNYAPMGGMHYFHSGLGAGGFGFVGGFHR